MIFLTSEEKAVIRRYAIVCQLWREGDQDFLSLEYDMAAGCSILPPSSVVGEAERLSVQSDPYTTWWRLLAAQLVFSTMCERTGAHASEPIRGMLSRCHDGRSAERRGKSPATAG